MSTRQARRAQAQVIEEFSLGAGRVTSLLRLPLVAIVVLIGVDVPRTDSHHAVFFSIWTAFAVWSLGVAWWMFRRPVPSWSAPLTTFVDLAAFVALAAASSGPTSYITPVFYLYPIAVAFQYRPQLTAVVGFVIAGGYVATWLPHLGKAGGPHIPLVVWLYAGLLLWLATASTTLTIVLVRRSAHVLHLLNVQRQLTVDTIASVERQRAQIAEELHDGPLQNLIAVRRDLEELALRHPESVLLARSDALLRETTQALRGTVTVLHPQVLAHLGLTPALRELALQYEQQARLRVHTELADIARTPLQEVLYSTARELLANISKHADADNVWISLTADPNELGLEVIDDGTGFDANTIGDHVANGHIGLASRSVRIAALGGSITIAGREPHGTHVSVRLPVHVGQAGSEVIGRRSPGGPPSRTPRTELSDRR